MPIQCNLFCNAFASSDPGAIGRFLGSELNLTNATEGRTVWINKKRGDRLATACFAHSVLEHQLLPLKENLLVFRGEIIKFEGLKEVESDPGADAESGERPGKKIKKESIEELCLPWKSTPYSDQLNKKKGIVQDVIDSALKGVRKQAKSRGYQPAPLWDQLEIHDTLYVPGDAAEPLENYRNKCEFTFGLNSENVCDIGFMHSRATATTEPVVAVGEDLMHVSYKIAEIVKSLRVLLRENVESFPLFSHRYKTGYWRMVSIRVCPITNESQVVIQSGPGGDERTQFEKIISDWTIIQQITSCYVQYNASVTDTIVLSDLHEMKHLVGSSTITMAIGPDARFQVHPLSFFQTNTRACEILYNKVCEWLQVGSDKPVLLDVCCGVGTIGQYIAKSHSNLSLVGIDIVPEAIENARSNADLNGLSGRAKYFSGRAEDVLPTIVGDGNTAVVDPPRSGLHKTVIRALRENEHIKSLVYVSCNPKTLTEDLVKLCEPLTSSADEEGIAVNHRFIPRKAVAVDMFPNTVHCEVVIQLCRP
jgi:tRNA (uracil-5-)-methyltransferase